MTKHEYLEQLKKELIKNNVPDWEEILSEYEAHFAFKLADGYGEEEIAARLAPPEMIAAQFDGVKGAQSNARGKKFLLQAALGVAVVLEGMVYILFFAWVAALAAGALAVAVAGICLIARLNIAELIPYMPYFGALVAGVCFLALAVLLAAAAYYCLAYARQIIRASARWHKNMLGGSALPPLPWNPQFSPKTGRALRRIVLLSLTAFGASLVLGFIVLMLQAGAVEFWHALDWFR